MSLNGQQYAWRRMPSRWYTSCSDWVESARLLPPDVFSLVTSSYRDTMRQVLAPRHPSSVQSTLICFSISSNACWRLSRSIVQQALRKSSVVSRRSKTTRSPSASPSSQCRQPWRGGKRERERTYRGLRLLPFGLQALSLFFFFFFSPQVRVLRAGFDQLRWVLLAGVTGVC